MVDVIVENLVEVFAAFLIAAIGIISAYLGKKLGKHEELKNILSAKDEAFNVMVNAVGELKQLYSDGFKEANADGKLTEEEIDFLHKELADRAVDFLSEPAKKVLEAAKIDSVNYILGIAEDYINQNH